MRIGLSSPLQHSSAEEWASRMQEIGCGSVVFPVHYTQGEETIQAYAKAARDHDLVIAEVGIWNNMLAADPAERKKALEDAKGQLKMADEIGAICCVNVAGTPAGPRWDGGYRENFLPETWEQTVATIQEVIDAVNPVNTKFSIESMPWMIPSGPEEYVKLMEDVNRPAMAAHLDIVNMITSPERYFFNKEFMAKCFEMLHGKICSCHLKDVALREEYTFQLRETYCGDGGLDLKEYIRLAELENPEMPMIIEHLASDEEYLDSLKYVQSIK